MQCVTPMYRRYIKGDHKTGQVISRAEAMQELEADPNNAKHKLNIYNKKSNYYQFEQIPCKKCWACQLNYSAEWATRIMLEAKESEYNWFITLTYDDDTLPIAEKTGAEIDGHIVEWENDGTWTGTLYPDDMKTFLNSLRKYFERKGHKGIKYYYCGEYGETTHRPHYHIILLHCPLDINSFYDTHIDSNFKAHWKSKELDRFWAKGKDKKGNIIPKGIIDIAELEWSCAAYVARYCTKKLMNAPKEDYLSIGKYPEYVRMSKGIGFKYYEKHKNEIYANDEMIMKTVKGNTGSFRPPKAFDRKFEEKDPEGFKLIKLSRQKAAERSRKILETLTDYTDLDNLRIKASNLQTKMSMLPRVGEW